MFQKMSQKIGDITFILDFRVLVDIFEIFAEDCFLLRSFRKFVASWFLPLSCFQYMFLACLLVGGGGGPGLLCIFSPVFPGERRS